MENYQNKWESRSSIRTRPRKHINFDQNGYFFPPDKQPLLLEPEVIALGEQVKEEILLHSFYKYLNDIVNLEIKLINSACNRLIYEDLIVNYSDSIKLNTYTVIIDEYYHVYTAKDMLLQLKLQFPHLEKIDYPTSDAYKAVNVIKEQLEESYHSIFEIIAVCIFETTLVRDLVEFFNSEHVHISIKHYVNDHMNDEAKHYSFFYNLLCYTWNHLPQDYKKNIGEKLASFIKLYLNINSEKEFNYNLLVSILKNPKKSLKIVTNLYRGFDITPEIPIVKNVLNVLQNAGLLNEDPVKKGFKEISWNL